jgi:serine/threonine protein kinase
MKIEQVDRHCDLFEARLRNGEKISAEAFLEECRIPAEHNLVDELRKLEGEYRNGKCVSVPKSAQVASEAVRPTELGPAELEETVIGSYKLLQKIGEGGMGVVYMAEQSRPVSRRVALKIVKPGMDTREVLARFEAERQALALMDHPNIARVLDAGTTEQGRPYFVMELVKGVPITTYCDERRLSLKERMELFLPVCHAMQHAHQKGIIHRDIKPSNVLVAQFDNRPIPKIIDFGLAKAFGPKLTEKTMFTQYGQIVGTIEYMSPEQASFNQLDVDTRSDIYSLGVLLYELLAGETPFDKKRLHSVAIDELLRIIRQEEPPRPSTRLSSHARLPGIAADRKSEAVKLSLLVRGELDWIVMKAIDKERDRRYQSAGALAEDIRRYLDGETVLACPPSTGYRFRKFARRNRVVLASAATVFGALLLGLAATSLAWYQANQETIRANDELGLRRREQVRTGTAIDVQRFQVTSARRFDDAACELLDRLAAQVSRDPRFDGAERQSLRHDLLADVIRFWDDLIAASVDRSGNPGPRRGYYRVQRALCLVRSGDHKQAFNEVRSLRTSPQDAEQYAYDLARVCALCASEIPTDPGLAELYVSDSIEHLRRASEWAERSPPSADHPDLSALKSHPEFEATLAEWLANWSRSAAQRSH